MTEAVAEKAPRGRVVSIDALRGFDMFWIIGGDAFFRTLLKNADSGWAVALRRQFFHTEWNGFTFYDLIFPLFLFIVGVSMTYSMGRRREKGAGTRELYSHVIKRFLTLMLLGYIYNGLLDFRFGELRHTGVLHRIAWCYLITSAIMIHTGKKGQATLAAGFLLLYWALMALVPVPGHGAGVLTPQGNLAGWIDRLLLPGRFYDYGGGDYLGILSTMPALSSTLLGVLAGHWLRSGASDAAKVRRLSVAGLASLLAALAWNAVFPINKPLWTSSYVLFAGGWSMLLLAAFYWVIDMRGFASWSFPFVVIGLNPITIYVAQSVFDFGQVADIFVHGFIDRLGAWEPLFYVCCVLAVKWLFVCFLYRQRIFLKA